MQGLIAESVQQSIAFQTKHGSGTQNAQQARHTANTPAPCWRCRSRPALATPHTCPLRFASCIALPICSSLQTRIIICASVHERDLPLFSWSQHSRRPLVTPPRRSLPAWATYAWRPIPAASRAGSVSAMTATADPTARCEGAGGSCRPRHPPSG